MCRIRMTRTIDGVEYTRLVDTTIGRVIFNEAVPQDLGMTKRETIDDMFKLEVDEKVGKKMLGKIVDACYRAHGTTRTAQMLDQIKELGYDFSTKRRADRVRGRRRGARLQEAHGCRKPRSRCCRSKSDFKRGRTVRKRALRGGHLRLGEDHR